MLWGHFKEENHQEEAQVQKGKYVWHSTDCEKDICLQYESWNKKADNGLVGPHACGVPQIFHQSVPVHKWLGKCHQYDVGVPNTFSQVGKFAHMEPANSKD